MAIMACLAGPKQLIEENKKGILLVAFTIGFLGYVALGGLLFLVIEGPQEELELKNIMNVKKNVMLKYPQLPGKYTFNYQINCSLCSQLRKPARNLHQNYSNYLQQNFN